MLMGARRNPSALPHAPTPVPALASAPDLIFRLRAWPELPEDGRTADIYRMLSVMSNQPVNRRWLLEHYRMAPGKLDQLLTRLLREGALEVIDPARLGTA
jgi:hypothetical protein